MVEKISDVNYCVSLDKTTHNGILRFTKELSIWINPCPAMDESDFISASALTSGGWFIYNTEEEKMFESDFPGVLAEAKKELIEYIDSTSERRDF